MIEEGPGRISRTVLERLEHAWNAGDGPGYAGPFADGADFVNVRGDLRTGPEIGPGHEQLFRGIYRGSSIGYRLLRARRVSDGVVLAHFRGSLRVPEGPEAGSLEALGSLVVVDTPCGPRVRAFHNTRIA